MRIALTERNKALVSAAFALLVGAGIWMHLQRERRRVDAGAVRVDVLVTRRYLGANRALTPDMVEKRRIPRQYAEPGALTDPRELAGGPDGARTRVAILKGEQLTRSKVEVAGARPGLAWAVPPGERALGLRLAPEHAAGGHLQPGDRVDVLSVSRRGGAGSAAVIAARARVLSVGERIWDPAGAPGAPLHAGVAESLIVSLSLSPASAARVADASDRSTLMLALVSPLGP